MDQNQFKVPSALLFKYFKYIWLLKFKSFQGFSRWCWTLTKTVSSHKLELKSFRPSWCSCIVFLFFVHSTLQLSQMYYNMLFSFYHKKNVILIQDGFCMKAYLHPKMLLSYQKALHIRTVWHKFCVMELSWWEHMPVQATSIFFHHSSFHNNFYLDLILQQGRGIPPCSRYCTYFHTLTLLLASVFVDDGFLLFTSVHESTSGFFAPTNFSNFNFRE